MGLTMSLDGYIAESQARAAAGDKNVTIISGAGTAQQVLRAALVDELHIDRMPILLGDGLRLFDVSSLEQVRLEGSQVVELPEARSHLRFRTAR